VVVEILFVAGGKGLPVGVECFVAEEHVVDPVVLPEVEVSGLHSGDGGAEGAVGSRTVGTQEDSEIEGGPLLAICIQVGVDALQSAQLLFWLLFSTGSSIFFWV
jgi:hypothetical protein